MQEIGVLVFRDEDGNLYLRVPDDQKAAVEQALAAQNQEPDTAGYGIGAGETSYAVGSLTRVGFILWQNPLPSRGIIVVGGRPR